MAYRIEPVKVVNKKLLTKFGIAISNVQFQLKLSEEFVKWHYRTIFKTVTGCLK